MSMIASLGRISDQQRQALARDPTPVADLLFSEQLPVTDLDKAWHGIHSYLCGEAWDGDGPGAFLLVGGAVVGDVDVGYGPARTFSPIEVEAIASFVGSIDADALVKRETDEALAAADLYPLHGGAPDDDFKDYVVANYGALRDFVAETARLGMALIVWTS